MNTYDVKCKYEDRKAGSQGRTIRVEATTIAGAIGKAARAFFQGLDRKQRFDANKGLTLEAARAQSVEDVPPEEPTETKSTPATA